MITVATSPRLVRMHGEYDCANADDLGAVLGVASESPGDLVVDMSAVTFFDASTITALVKSRLDLEADGRHLELRSPTLFGRELLDVCGLAHLIESTAGSPGS